jgi:hypothetical protein
MPKVKYNSVKLKGFAQDTGEQYFGTDGEIIFCKLCEVKVAAEKCFTVQQHCSMTKHKNNLSRDSTKESRQHLFENASATSPSNKMSEFYKDLFHMMVSANIPLNKVSNQQFKYFFEKYTNQHIPSESTMQRNCLPVMKMF